MFRENSGKEVTNRKEGIKNLKEHSAQHIQSSRAFGKFESFSSPADKNLLIQYTYNMRRQLKNQWIQAEHLLAKTDTTLALFAQAMGMSQSL